MTITPREFVDRWAQSALRETQAYQSHFNELCQLVGHKTPVQLDPQGERFTFEENVVKATGGRGRADVWYKDHFAWEYKGKHKDLDAAYHQLLAYRGGLDNPPLLVVSDFLEYRIYPQWSYASGQPFVFHNEDLLHRDAQRYITWLLEDPEAFLRLRQEELKRRETITRDLADKFAHLYDLMERSRDASGQARWQPMQIARFLTKLVFALFAEDIGLMPRPFDRSVFRYIVEYTPQFPEEFVPFMQELFRAMDGHKRSFMLRPVPYFNGGLFADSAPGAGDGTEALDLMQIIGALDLLEQVSEADWRAVNPTIFGTLFEGALDKSKRAQLGAHYTGESDIRLVVEPVLMAPLYREWDAVRAEAEPLLQTYLNPEAAPRQHNDARTRLLALHDAMMKRLEDTRVLDPACGSGNFLYVSLRLMKDLEAQVRKFFEPLGLPFRDVVTPRQLYGIEKDPFAARLAHVVCWIGYLQWRYEDEGVLHPLLRETSSPHPRQLPSPIIQDKYRPDEPDHILNADAIMRYDADGSPYEPDWPEVDVIMGNPPFLGGNRIRGELGDYVDRLFELYEDRVPAFADLVCYWFEKARAQIESGKARRAGLLATNSIRGGVNREVLDRIKETGDIFMAWSDREWVLEGAAVRISIVGFEGKVLTPRPPLQRIGEGESDSPPHRHGEGQGVGTTPYDDEQGGGTGWVHTYKSTEVWHKIKPLARQMRQEPTPPEQALWERLRNSQVQGYKFRRQHPIDRFIVDFYCADAWLVVEVDGPIHDYTPEEDALRQEFLESLGLRVLRFRNDEVLQGIESVIARLEEAVLTPRPPLQHEEAVLTPRPPLQRIGEGESDSPPHRHGEGQGVGTPPMLDGLPVASINADLTASVDLTEAQQIPENADLCFMGPSPKAAFDITEDVAKKMLAATNPSGRSNSDVVRPVVSGVDIVRRSRREWTIDFGLMPIEEAKLYVMPFEYVEQHVYPVRSQNRRAAYAEKWWQYAEARPGLRNAISGKKRFVVTPTLASHRLFMWGHPESLYNQQTITIARDDDYFFGVLHSYLHEIWALRLGTSLEDRPRYTPTTTFETFPFPYPPGKEDTASPAYAAISAAARQLHEEREAWLNPPDLLALGATESSPALRERTLTNLYNALAAHRARSGNGNGEDAPLPAERGGVGGGDRIPKAARDFAPRLAQLHDALDAAVLAAYGWDDLAPSPLGGDQRESLRERVGEGFSLRTLDGDEELLRRLLALNLTRAG